MWVNSLPSEGLLTVEEVAERLRFKPATIQGWLRRGQLQGVKIGKVWRVPEDALQAWVLQHRRTSS